MEEFTREGERIEVINDDLRVIRHKTHLPFGSDALLLAGYLRRGGRAAELGAGTGAVSLLAAVRKKYEKIDGYEMQESAVEVFVRNIALNALEERVCAINADIRFLPCSLKGSYDCVFSNPPYMKSNAGRSCAKPEKEAARHETAGDIRDFARAASSLLKTGGEAVFVYRPDRMIDLVAALREVGIEPKRMTAVSDRRASVPSVVLVSAKKGGAAGLYFTPAFILHEEDGRNSEEYAYLLKEGVFPDRYVKP